MYQEKIEAGATPEKKNRKPRLGTVIFYSIYFICVAAALFAINALMVPLEDWLVTYQSSQPENKSQEIFTQLFAQPDWEALYTQAELTDTTFEGKEAFAAYMKEKVGTEALTYMETSAGLSGDRKYVVRLGDEKIATYTMTGTENEETKITTWELDTVELFFTRNRSVTVKKAPGQTVYINGVALDDSHTVKTTDTLAEEYLPEGVHGYRAEVQYLDGLLVTPEVTVKNADGTDAAVTVDENGIYTVAFPEMVISEEEEKIAIGAARANALFAIRAISTTELRKHFDASSKIYKSLCKTNMFLQVFHSYKVDDSATVVSDYYRYSDDLFSAHVFLRLNVIRTDGTVKAYDTATHYFFTRQENGEFRVTDLTNLNIQKHRDQVRLTFVTDEQTASMMVDASALHLTLPQVTVPNGQTFRGWAIQEQDEAGRTVMTIVFTPDESGNVSLSGSQALEPMTLYPVFETEK